MEIIGRERERQTLRRYELSAKPEFVAVYGRRRVGKTFLHVTMISASGLVQNAYCNEVQSMITLDDLFQPRL